MEALLLKGWARSTWPSLLAPLDLSIASHQINLVLNKLSAVAPMPSFCLLSCRDEALCCRMAVELTFSLPVLFSCLLKDQATPTWWVLVEGNTESYLFALALGSPGSTLSGRTWYGQQEQLHHCNQLRQPGMHTMAWCG